MLYVTILTVHLIVAALTGLAASFAVVALWQRSERVYRSAATILALLAAFEVLSGAALSIISPNVTAVSLCANIAVYLSAVVLVEALLFYRMKKISMSFPLVNTIAPAMMSLLLFVGAIVYGF